ncbi:hypothetical protein HPP92_010227 [Vanilla planifolia]|uniref:Uncharacterized protein n=1 Tax=Vanilla planifolia TaxID=51239 RepID=A0A835QZQ7_VANPL|nr:hypothetical protein HPP92_010227 [Vanilla planifolia]
MVVGWDSDFRRVSGLLIMIREKGDEDSSRVTMMGEINSDHNLVDVIVLDYNLEEDEDHHIKAVLDSLRRRAHLMTDGFNSCRNVVCNFTQGAMYSFPQIRLPPKAIEAAKKAGKLPDVFYCLKLLEATGISTVPGSGFGQKEGDVRF